MFKLNSEEIIKEIVIKTGRSEKEINSMIDKKLTLLNDLVSREGAAHITANELGVKLVPEYIDKKFKINKLIPGLNFVNLDAKIISIYEVRSFKNEKREGKVGSLVIGDETGIARLVLWDTKLIDMVENSKIKEGDIISLKNGYCKENNSGIEIHLGNKSDIFINPENVDIKEVRNTRVTAKKSISELKENENAEISGTVVQLFEPRFYHACPQCKKKSEFVDGNYLCSEHGVVMATDVPIVNFFLDDGTDNIRVVCFRELANKMLDDKFQLVKEDPSAFDIVKKEMLGRQVKVNGRVNKNTMFDRLEFNAQAIEELDPVELVREFDKGN